MVSTKVFLNVAICFVLISNGAFGQGDSAQMKTTKTDVSAEKIRMFEEAFHTGNLKNARASLNWLLKNSPDLSSDLYQQGAKVFDKLASLEKSTAYKNLFVDSLMILYDLHIRYRGEEAQVQYAKALSYLKFNAQTKPVATLHVLDRVFELYGYKVPDDLLLPYIETVKLCASQRKTLSDGQIMERYNRLMNVTDAKIRQAEGAGLPVEMYKRSKDDIDAVLISMIQVDCAFVKKNLEPRFKKDPSDLALARKIFSFMLQGQCVDDPLWLQAGETIHARSVVKDYALTRNLALKYYHAGNYARAEVLLTEALPMASMARDKSEMLLYLGELKAMTDKPEARSLFFQVLEEDRGNKIAYEKIGDLYYNSANDCSRANKMDDGLVYLLAADYYQRAGNGKKVALARLGFPTKEEIVSNGCKTGQLKSVGCWIGESTTLRTRN